MGPRNRRIGCVDERSAGRGLGAARTAVPVQVSAEGLFEVGLVSNVSGGTASGDN